MLKGRITYPPVIKLSKSWSSTWILIVFTLNTFALLIISLCVVMIGWTVFPMVKYAYTYILVHTYAKFKYLVITSTYRIYVYVYVCIYIYLIYDSSCFYTSKYHVATGCFFLVTWMTYNPLIFGQSESSWINCFSISGNKTSATSGCLLLFSVIIFKRERERSNNNKRENI